MRYKFNEITGIYQGVTNENLPNSTELVPRLQNENNVMRWVVNGWVEITQAERIQREKDYFESLKTIEQLKKEKKELVKEKENKKINSGVEYNGHFIDSNDKAQKFLTSLLSSVTAELISDFHGFTTKENIDINLSAQDVKNIAALLLQHVANCHKWKREKYAEIEAATTKEELEAIEL